MNNVINFGSSVSSLSPQLFNIIAFKFLKMSFHVTYMINIELISTSNFSLFNIISKLIIPFVLYYTLYYFCLFEVVPKKISLWNLKRSNI